MIDSVRECAQRKGFAMPVKISRFQPVSMDRVAELRRSKGRKGSDPGMEDLLDAVESGDPQEVRVEEGTNPRGMRIAMARAAGRRGLTVETFESEDENGSPVVVVVKGEPDPVRQKSGPSQPAGNGRKRGGPRKQEQDDAEIASLQDLAKGES